MALKTNRVVSFIWHSPLVEWPLAILGERPCTRIDGVTCLKKVASVSKIHRLLLSTLAGNFECWISDVAKLFFHAFGDEMDGGITACASAARRPLGCGCWTASPHILPQRPARSVQTRFA